MELALKTSGRAKKVCYRTCPRFVLTNIREREEEKERRRKGETKEGDGERNGTLFKAFTSLTEGAILRGGFAVFIPSAGVAKCQCP
jgi:hypothetical protein